MDNKWLTLKQAAIELDVHPTTLRRWADNGDVPLVKTPGGHRRFLAEDIEKMAQSQRQPKPTSGVEKVWADQALVETRKELGNVQDASWMQNQSTIAKQEYRQLGRQLMGVIMQHIAGEEEEDDEVFVEAQKIGRSYATTSLSQQMPLSDALRSFLFFRDMMVETSIQLPDTAKKRPGTNSLILRRINDVLNVVQLAIVDAYES